MLNDVNLIGNLGSAPDGKKIGDDNFVCKFSLATSKKQKHHSGTWQEVTQWHRIVVWGKVAENCVKFLQKGSEVFITGEINYGSYDKDGTKIYTTDIVARNVKFLSNIKSSTENNQSMSAEDIPF